MPPQRMSPNRRAEKKLPTSSLHPNYQYGAGKSTMNPSKIHEALANGAPSPRRAARAARRAPRAPSGAPRRRAGECATHPHPHANRASEPSRRGSLTRLSPVVVPSLSRRLGLGARRLASLLSLSRLSPRSQASPSSSARCTRTPTASVTGSLAWVPRARATRRRATRRAARAGTSCGATTTRRTTRRPRRRRCASVRARARARERERESESERRDAVSRSVSVSGGG